VGNPLPDIRTLTEDPTIDVSRRAARAGCWLSVIPALAALVWSATIAWGIRERSGLPDPIHGIFAAGCVLVPCWIAAVAVRREGVGMLPMLAVIAPVVVFLLVCCWSIIANVT